MKRFAPEGALAYLSAGGGKARWIYDEPDLARARKQFPEQVVVVRSRTTRAELAAELLCCAGESDAAVGMDLAEALIRGRPLAEVFEIAKRRALSDARHAWLVTQCERLKLRVEVFGVGWLTSARLEVESEEEGLDVASGYEYAVRCSFFRGDSLVSQYRKYQSEFNSQWRREEEPAERASGT